MKKGISNLTKEIVEFDEKKIKYFGVDVFENTTAKGKFSSFRKQNFIKTTEKIYVDYLLSDIRKWFDKSVLISKKEHFKRKKDKTLKAISKQYEVVNKNVVYLPEHDFKSLLKCNLHKTLFVYKKLNFYYVIDNFFRNTETEDYLYIDKENKQFIKSGFNLIANRPSKKKLLDWEQQLSKTY